MKNIAVIGLGYVGLPLALAFAQDNNVVGFDLNAQRICDLNNGFDSNGELDQDEVTLLSKVRFSTEPEVIKNCNYKIITVPTPIDSNNEPDLGFLINASKTVGQMLMLGDTVIYESTVYPGLTEDVCIPIIEKESGLRRSSDFYFGYSPERINPGDQLHRLKDIKKIVSGCSLLSTKLIKQLYSEIIDAGVYVAPNIKVAEAAKVIENTQRDLNIALVNELSMIFDRIGIDTTEVLDAAATKWNFLRFSPGLVGGHCIGVDPFYLTYKAQQENFNPKVILAGREINDNMPLFISGKVKEFLKADNFRNKPKILLMGATFKENCSDIRNSQTLVLAEELSRFSEVFLTDPFLDQFESETWKFVQKFQDLQDDFFDFILLAVRHDFYASLGPEEIRRKGNENSYFFDLKSLFTRAASDWRL